MALSAKQIGAYALIAIFILSTVAIYMGGFSSSGSQDQPDASKILSGYVTANATLSSYGPVIEIQNSSDEVKRAISEFKSKGIISQQIDSANSSLLTISDTSKIPEISSTLERFGASVFAPATVNTGPLLFVSGSSTQTLEGISYKLKLKPVFLEGESFPITFSATSLEGQLYTYSTPSIVPASDFTVRVAPKSTSVASRSTLIVVPWENRNISVSQFNSNLSDGESVNYSPRSYVMFYPPVSTEVLQQLSLSKPAYITSLQPSSFSISPDFLDSAKITEDLKLFNISPLFPPSIVALASKNQSELASKFLAEFSDLPAQAAETYVLEFDLGDSVLYNGARYFLPLSKATFTSEFPPQDGYEVEIRATPVGNRISSYAISSYSASQAFLIDEFINSPSDSQMPALNGSGGPSMPISQDEAVSQDEVSGQEVGDTSADSEDLGSLDNEQIELPDVSNQTKTD